MEGGHMGKVADYSLELAGIKNRLVVLRGSIEHESSCGDVEDGWAWIIGDTIAEVEKIERRQAEQFKQSPAAPEGSQEILFNLLIRGDAKFVSVNGSTVIQVAGNDLVNIQPVVWTPEGIAGGDDVPQAPASELTVAGLIDQLNELQALHGGHVRVLVNCEQIERVEFAGPIEGEAEYINLGT
jgi:hypothetical protein